jgi:hypothetical protein
MSEGEMKGDALCVEKKVDKSTPQCLFEWLICLCLTCMLGKTADQLFG